METQIQNQNSTATPATIFIASTTKGWVVVSENGIKLSGYYKNSQQAKDALKNLVSDSNVEVVMNVPEGTFFG